MMSLDNKKSVFKNRRGIPFLSLIILLNVCLGCASVSIPPEISDAIGTISEKKSLCEGMASKVKKDFTRDTKEYQKTNTLYIEAKAAFDGWIDRLKFDLTADIDINNAATYKESLNKASEKGDIFLKYVDSLTSEKTKSIVAVTSILPSLTDAGIKIWENYRIAAKEKREEIKKGLDSLKWKAFDEI
ncbi:MAG: hypothetical protein M1406_08175 [Nitrospirae bacterium]|nr:hypothetical protein [Nitrospirota bacterium]